MINPFIYGIAAIWLRNTVNNLCLGLVPYFSLPFNSNKAKIRLGWVNTNFYSAYFHGTQN